MVKKIALGVLIVLLLGGAWWQNTYIKGATERLTTLLGDVQRALDEDDFDAAVVAADEFSAQWKKEKQVYEALIDHDDIDLISATTARMKSYCDTRFREGALAETHALLFYVRHLKDIDTIGWENIF